jgi:hypothetical protein
MYRLIASIWFLAAGNLFAEVLVIHADAECRLSVDGKARGILIPGKPVQVKLMAGEHHVEATPVVGGNKWLQSVTIQAARNQASTRTSSHSPHVLNILVSQPHDYWIDAATSLMWTAADNGSGLSWGQALRYCAELKQDGFKDWTLPGIEQLQHLFTSATETGGFHIKGPIKLSGWQWSSSAGQQSGEGWAFDFGDGGRASVAAGDSGLNRALCVRPAN